MLLVLNDDIFPKNLAYLRKKRKLSQVKLAQQAGIDVYLLRGIERGQFRADLQIGQYISLCRILQVSPSLMGSYDVKTCCNTKDCTEDPEELLNYLSENGHPVLGMDPFDM